MKPAVAADGTGARRRVLVVVVAEVRRGTGAVGGERRVVDLDHPAQTVARDGDPVVISASVRQGGVDRGGQIGEAQLVHVVRGAGGSTKWVRRIRVTLAAVNGPAFLPEKKEARPSEFAQGGSDLAARLTERDRRQIGRDGGSLHQVRPKTEELHEEDRGELANADL